MLYATRDNVIEPIEDTHVGPILARVRAGRNEVILFTETRFGPDYDRPFVTADLDPKDGHLTLPWEGREMEDALWCLTERLRELMMPGYVGSFSRVDAVRSRLTLI